MAEFYFEIEQHSLEWHEIKHGKIGGTRAKELFVKSDTLLLRLLSEHIEPFDEDYEDSYKSDDMERGNFLEPQARIELEKYTGLKFYECGWIQSDNKLLGISPDGITLDKKVQCELKCLNAVNHLKICLENEIPLDKINQCVHAFTVNDKLEIFYFASYRPENELKPLFVKKLTRESIVNNGTKAKPIMVSISDLVTQSIKEAELLEKQIEQSINKLSF